MASAAESPAVLFESYVSPSPVLVRMHKHVTDFSNVTTAHTPCATHTPLDPITLNRTHFHQTIGVTLLQLNPSLASPWNTETWPEHVACLYESYSRAQTRALATILHIVEGMSRPLPMLSWRWHERQLLRVAQILRRPPQKYSSRASRQSGMFFRWVSRISIRISFSI